MTTALRALVALLLALLVTACAAEGPHEIRYDGSESCAFCRMAITDRRHGAQAILGTGKVLLFDSAECLAGWVRAGAGDAAGDGRSAPRASWVTDARTPGRLVAVDRARFVRSARPGASPMGRGLIAVGIDAEPATLAREHGVGPDRILDWPQVLALVADGAPAGHGHD